MYDILTLNEMLVHDLREVAEEFQVNLKGLKKQDIIYQILEKQAVMPEVYDRINLPKKKKLHPKAIKNNHCLKRRPKRKKRVKER